MPDPVHLLLDVDRRIGSRAQGHGTLLYVLCEVLSNTPVAAIQLEHAKTGKLLKWLVLRCASLYRVLDSGAIL